MAVYEDLVYANFVVAVGLLVVVPLGLLLASVNLRAVRARLLVYWRVSALLAITVYLWIGETPMGFATGYLAQALIPLALLRGDAFMVLRRQPVPTIGGWRTATFRYWRMTTIYYHLAGLAYMIPLLPCIWGDEDALCQAWYAPPQEYAAWLHPTVEPIWLARYGWVALGVYAAYLLSTAVRLQRDLLEHRDRGE